MTSSRARGEWAFLIRFEHGKAGSWRPPAWAEARRRETPSLELIDPHEGGLICDERGMIYVSRSAALQNLKRAGVLLHPLRPGLDLPVLKALSEAGVALLPGMAALEHFGHPLSPYPVLHRAGIPLARAAWLRRPHDVREVVDRLGLPLELHLPLHFGATAPFLAHDLGSVIGQTDRLWRQDLTLLMLPAPKAGESDTWTVSLAGDGAPPLARAALEALGLPFGAVRLRTNGDRSQVVAVRPFPAAPGQVPAPETLARIEALLGAR